MKRLPLEKLIYTHREALYRLCLHLEHNTYYAEELFQDTWVKAIEKLDTYDTTCPFYPWLSKIAINLYRDRLRRIKVEMKYTFWGQDAIQEPMDTQVDIENAYITEEELAATKRCLSKLEDKYRLPILLSISYSLSYKDIAHILDEKETTIKSRIFEGRRKLKTMLDKEGFHG